MINNVAPEKLVNIYGAQSYTKLYIQHSFNMDTDLLGKAFWVYNASQVQVKEWLVTDPGQLGYTSVTIPGLVQDTPYTIKGQFYDQMIDPELLAAKFGINISDSLSLRTKKAPTLTNITVTATQVEVGVSNPTVNFFCQGDADFVEIQYKLTSDSTWSSCYSGQVTSPISLIMPIGTYNFRIRGNIGLPDGVTIEQSQWYQYPSSVVVQYMQIPPSKPTGIRFAVQKIKDGVERYDVKVEWDWTRANGQQIKQFIVEYTPTAKFNASGWTGAQQVNTSSTPSQILVNFPFDIEFKLRVVATQWGPNDGTMTTYSDVATMRITTSTPITDNFTKETGVEVGYYGINQYKGTGAQRVQTFKLDQATGNLSIGIADAQGKVPFSFDAVNNIFNVSGRIITDTINAASFVLTNTSGTSPSLYSQEKPQFGNANQGIWMGYNSTGKFLFDLGNSAQYVRWDGTTLKIQGNVVIGTPGGDTSITDALKGKSVVPIYQAAQSAPAKPTATAYPPAGWSTSPPAFNPQTQKVWVCTGIIDPLTNVLVSGETWSTPVQFSGQNGQDGQDGDNGKNNFKSIVFIRSNSQPQTPTGGSYSSPIPTTSGWSDGVPQGTQKLWSSTRIFSSDGGAPQQSTWSTPQQLTDTASLEVMYSSVTNSPGNPTDNAANWYSAASTSSIWMQTRTSSNGVWAQWSISKIKGEQGIDGKNNFKSIVFTRSNSQPQAPTGGSYSSPIPTTQGWSDGIPEGTQKLWSSTRIFSSDGGAPQQGVWSTPQQLTDTASLEVMYSSVASPGNPTDNAANWYSTASTSSIWMQTRTSSNGIWSQWSIQKIKGEQGTDGKNNFKSIVFTRSNSQPQTPTGGSYSSPVPTTQGWSDGIPDGTQKLWSSTRIFSSDGGAPQQSTWSTPQQLTDTASLEVMYSSVASSPGNPTANPSNWSYTASTSSIWMQTRTSSNGIWSQWSIQKIKGEQGDQGSDGKNNFKSIVFIRSNSQPQTPAGGSYSSPVPTTQGWSDGIPQGTQTLWSSTRVFSSDGGAPQQAAWSAPQQLTDTASLEIMYSSVVSSPGNPTTSPANWSTTASSSSIWMQTRTGSNGVWSQWSVQKIKGEQGDQGADGKNNFKSIVFTRSNSQPQTPAGGSYSSPLPTTQGWSDGIPQGTQKLWSSTRIFSSDGGVPQQSAWSTPQQLTDTASLELMYSSVASSPGDPTANPANWSSTASTSSIWMQTRTSSNGIWSQWSVQKIKGEQGATGAPGAPGAPGAAGARGPGIYQNSVVDTATDFNVSSANQFFINTFGSQQVIYDCLTQYRVNNPQVAWTRMWNGSAWVQPALMVHGDIIANGTIRGEKMVADQAFFQKAGINVIYDRAAQLSANPEGTYKMKIDLASGFIHIR